MQYICSCLLKPKVKLFPYKKDKVVIKIKGKTGSSSDAENPEKWKSYEG